MKRMKAANPPLQPTPLSAARLSGKPLARLMSSRPRPKVG